MLVVVLVSKVTFGLKCTNDLDDLEYVKYLLKTVPNNKKVKTLFSTNIKTLNITCAVCGQKNLKRPKQSICARRLFPEISVRVGNKLFENPN